MTEHNLFYYPYASFTNAQLPLLKVAALWFDKLIILDPVGASWDTIGADRGTCDAVRLLKDADILELITPATVLKQYAGAITEAIRRDMGDRAFLELCEAHGRTSGKQRWTLSLAKVPQDLQADRTMRHLMGDFARQLIILEWRTKGLVEEYQHYDETEVGENLNQTRRFYEALPQIPVYSETRDGYGANVEYRYADVPLALGEAIMMNHALFGGLFHAGATPITDDPFHSRALAHKLARVAQEPAIRRAISNRVAQRQIKATALAATALTDSQLNLPILSAELPLEEVLEYRQKHDAALRQARETLGWMARRIEAEPWSAEFAKELEHKTIPDLAKELDAARQARDSWLSSKRGRLALKAAGIGVGAAAAVLAVFAAPLTPIALATASLAMVSSTAIPGAEWLFDWRDGKKTMHENGLHYLLRV